MIILDFGAMSSISTLWPRKIGILKLRKCIAFVKYSHRFYAEFAKEAMQDQRIDDSNDTIFITWAEDSKIQTGKNKSTSQIA